HRSVCVHEAKWSETGRDQPGLFKQLTARFLLDVIAVTSPSGNFPDMTADGVAELAHQTNTQPGDGHDCDSRMSRAVDDPIEAADTAVRKFNVVEIQAYPFVVGSL